MGLRVSEFWGFKVSAVRSKGFQGLGSILGIRFGSFGFQDFRVEGWLASEGLGSLGFKGSGFQGLAVWGSSRIKGVLESVKYLARSTGLG